MPVNTFNLFDLQFSYTKYVLGKFWVAKGFGKKFRALFYGPGFSEDLPEYRLGRNEDIPKVDPKYQPYDPKISILMSLYACITSFTGVHLLQEETWAIIHKMPSPTGHPYSVTLVAVLNFVSAGLIFSGNWQAKFVEIIKFTIILPIILNYMELAAVYYVSSISFGFILACVWPTKL